MKNVIQSLLLLTIFLFMISCNKREEKEKIEQYNIEASLSGFPDGTKFYLKNLTTDANIDSTEIQNGKFKMDGHFSNPPEQLWLIAVVDKNSYYTNLLIGNDSLRVQGDIKDFPWNVQKKGSEIQSEYNRARELTKNYDIERDTLITYFVGLAPKEQQEQGKKIWQRIAVIDSTALNKRLNNLKHNNSYISIIDLGYLKKELPKDSIKKIFDAYSDTLKNSKYGNVIKVYLESKIKNIGDSIYDFKGINQNDKKIKLSSIRDNSRFTLIDFTSAFCGPCIKAADELNSIQNSYKDSLKIVSFSGDPRKEAWLKGVVRDKVEWNSIWDGKGRFSETSIIYGINGFPTFILINKKGIIIDKWSGYSEGSLKSRIEKNLGI